jgi:hypothetical protein
MIPADEFSAAARSLAGIVNCSTGSGSGSWGFGGSSAGGFSTGTVNLSLPGSSTCRGGSFI